MRAIRKLNNNAVVCLDSSGREMIALGRGLGFGTIPREISLVEVERTFYNIDENDQNLVQGLPTEVVAFTAKFLDIAANELPYALRPNATLLLADHIVFAIKRTREKMRVRMPLAYDVQQIYPIEYGLGEYAVNRIRRDLKVYLPDDEATGIALNLVNAKADSKQNLDESVTSEFAEMLEDITEIVESEFHIVVDRNSFSFTRYATHLQYLFQRIHQSKTIDSENIRLYKDLHKEFPEISVCVDKIAAHIEKAWACKISEEEKLYLILHVNRIRAKERAL